MYLHENIVVLFRGYLNGLLDDFSFDRISVRHVMFQFDGNFMCSRLGTHWTAQSNRKRFSVSSRSLNSVAETSEF